MCLMFSVRVNVVVFVYCMCLLVCLCFNVVVFCVFVLRSLCIVIAPRGVGVVFSCVYSLLLC